MSPKFRALIFLPLLALFLLFPAHYNRLIMLLSEGQPPLAEDLEWISISTVSPVEEAPVEIETLGMVVFEPPLPEQRPAGADLAELGLPAPALVEITQFAAEVVVEEAGSAAAQKEPEIRVQFTAPAEHQIEQVPDEVKRLQHQVFNELWALVYENYLYPDYNGVDWQAVRREQRERIDHGQSLPVFYQTLSEIMASLGDEHSRFLDPERTAAEDARFAGNQGIVGVGVFLAPVPERNRAALLAVAPGGPADRAGLQPRDSILLVDGQPLLDENGRLKSLLRGPEGTQVEVLAQSPGQEPRLLILTRQRVSGPLPLPHTVISTSNNQRIGYVLFLSFGDSTIPEQFGQALQTMNEQGSLDGLIIDNRFNEGGADTVLRGLLSYFTQGRLGSFISRRSEKAFEIEAIDLYSSQSIPVAVLVGKATFSFGEIFSGVLQDQGRAYLIGEQTLGNVESLRGYNFKDGSRAWIAQSSFRPQNRPDADWEGRGLFPDLAVFSAWDEHTLESDPAVLAAAAVFLGEPFDLSQLELGQDLP